MTVARAGGRPRVLVSLAAWIGEGLGGGDAHILGSARRWTAHADVTILCPRRSAPLARSHVPGARVVTIRTPPGPGNAAVLAAEYLRRIVPAARAARRAGMFDVAVAATHFLPDAASLAAARAPRRAVFAYHLIPATRHAGVRTAMARAGEAAGLAWHRRLADLVFVSNRETAEALGGWRRVVRTAVGVDLAPYRDLARPDPPAADLVYVGRLVPTKRPDHLVRAFRVLRARHPGARLVVVGTGGEAEAARALAEELGVADGIAWMGFLGEREKREALAGARLMLFPSVEEGWGIAVCEALAAGTPVAAYDLPVFGELFEEGMVRVAVGDHDALGRAAADLLADPVRCAALGAAGRAAVARYDLDEVAERELGSLLARS